MATCPAGHESQASDYCDTCGRVIGGGAAAPTAVAPAASAAPAAAAPGPGGCPVCGAVRDGRFCEECGYDYDLAEVMPATVLSPGIRPVEPTVVIEPVSVPAPAQPVGQPTVLGEPAAAGERAAGEDGGLDLEAELARAEQRGGANASSAPDVTAPDLPVVEPEAPASTPAAGGGLPGEELTLVVDADREYYDAQVGRGDIIEADFPFPKYTVERRFTFTEGPVRVGRISSSRGLNPEIDLTGPPLDPAVSHLHAQLLRHEEGWVVVDLGSANGTRLNDSDEPLEAETEIPVKQGDRIHLGVWTTITVL